MRNMSFAMTTDQIKSEQKTVTRRFGWWFLKPGDTVTAVEKGMGLKKGEKVKPLKVLEIVSIRKEPLNAITQEDVIAEGFPDKTPEQFVAMLVEYYKIKPDAICNRIEFKYVDETFKTASFIKDYGPTAGLIKRFDLPITDFIECHNGNHSSHQRIRLRTKKIPNELMDLLRRSRVIAEEIPFDLLLDGKKYENCYLDIIANDVNSIDGPHLDIFYDVLKVKDLKESK